jgi:hypothetical protein
MRYLQDGIPTEYDDLTGNKNGPSEGM